MNVAVVVSPEGVIERGRLYQKDEFLRIAQICEGTFKLAKRRGLKVSKVHNRIYISGDDWLDYLCEQAAARDAD